MKARSSSSMGCCARLSRAPPDYRSLRPHTSRRKGVTGRIRCSRTRSRDNGEPRSRRERILCARTSCSRLDAGRRDGEARPADRRTTACPERRASGGTIHRPNVYASVGLRQMQPFALAARSLPLEVVRVPPGGIEPPTHGLGKCVDRTLCLVSAPISGCHPSPPLPRIGDDWPLPPVDGPRGLSVGAPHRQPRLHPEFNPDDSGLSPSPMSIVVERRHFPRNSSAVFPARRVEGPSS
jgi:hypothetical protein